MSVEASTTLQSPNCSIRIERHEDGAIVVAIEGHDTGAFGALPMRCIEAFMPDEGQAVLTIDARRARGATMHVSNEWARWLSAHRDRLASVQMHVASEYVRVTADFVRRFAGLEPLMRIEVHER